MVVHQAYQLIVVDRARELFRRVIAMSPPLGISLGREAMAARLLAQLPELPELPEVLDDAAVAAAQARVFC